MTLVISMFFGAVLGMRRSVFALYPAFVIAVAPIVGSAAMYGSSVWSTLFAMQLSAIGLQIGFLGGLATRFAWRLRRRPPYPARRAEVRPRLCGNAELAIERLEWQRQREARCSPASAQVIRP